MAFKIPFISIGLMSLVLASCGTNNKPSTPRISSLLAEQTQQDGRACVRDYQIRGYNVKHWDIILLDAGRKHYVATTFQRCSELSSSNEAIFFSRFHEICGGSSKVITRDGNCTIDKIFEFDNRDEAKAAVEQAFEARQQARTNTLEESD